MSLLINNIDLVGIKNMKGSVAIYYKTEPFMRDISDYSHTNNWEILKSVEIWNQHGFVVDLIDRGNKNWEPSKKYDVFLGLGVGDTGEQFPKYANLSGANKRVLIAMGPHPIISNQRVLERYREFANRTGVNAPPTRTVSLTQKKYDEIIDTCTAIVTIGQVGVQSYKSLAQSGKEMFVYPPAVSPNAYCDDFSKRQKNTFLAFVGNGMICKGIDILIEAFLKIQDCNLVICGPPEQGLIAAYPEVFSGRVPNISYKGFIRIDSKQFQEIVAKCSWIISNSSSEACATAVATCMSAGLVPIVNSWTSINTSEIHGIEIVENGDRIENTINAIRLSQLETDYSKLVKKTMHIASNFSQKSYIREYTKIVERLIA